MTKFITINIARKIMNVSVVNQRVLLILFLKSFSSTFLFSFLFIFSSKEQICRIFGN